MRNLARIAFFLSGIAGLTFEIVWLRHLGWVLGTTTLAMATTTAAYMGGLALGSHFGGRFADRLRRPLAWYGAMELVVASLGAAIPWVCHHLPGLYAQLLPAQSSTTLQALTRLLLAFIVLMVPTVGMGATLPVLARAVTQRADRVGHDVGVLYALNIAGGVLGAAICGFWLIPSLGMTHANALAVGLDLGLGAVALGLGLWMRAPGLVATSEVTASVPVWRPGTRTLVVLLGFTGAAAMALQVLWSRALGTVLGPSTYAFSAIICAYLTGLAIGGWVAARVADRITTVRLALVVAFLVTGFFTLVGMTWVDDLPTLLQGVVLKRDLTMDQLIRAEFLLAALAILPATIGMGALFPLTLSAVAGSDLRIGAAVGRAYAVNTLGAICGSFAGLFILLAAFGVEGGMRACALVYVVAGLLLTRRLEPSVHPIMRYGAATLALALGACIVLWPSWDVGRWTAGLYRLSMTRSYYADTAFVPPRIAFHQDGLASTVTVEEDDGVRWVKVNGKIDGSSEGDMPTQVLSGLLGFLVHPQPHDVAIIGCGTCVTVGAALQGHPDRVTLVELEKQVVAAAHLFSDVNHAPWNDTRVSIVEDDGRNFMSQNGTPFDLIVSEPSNPWMTGAASLFTVEFFRTAQTRLNHDGLFVQWLQLYELAPDRIASVLKTFHAVFPSVLVFSAHPDSNDLLLVGSSKPLHLQWENLQDQTRALTAELKRADIEQASDVLPLLLFTQREIDMLPNDVPLNTDDNAYIEFGAPRDLLAFAEDDAAFPLLTYVQGKRATILRDVVASQAPWSTVLAQATLSYMRRGMLEDAQAAARLLRDPETHASAQDLDAVSDVEQISTLLSEDDRVQVVSPTVLDQPSDLGQAVHLMLSGQEGAALHYLEDRPSLVQASTANTLLYGYMLYRNEQYEAARKTLQRVARAADAVTVQPALTYYLARSFYFAGDYKNAVQHMQRFRELHVQPTDAVDD